ncbi:MAG: DNA topoisomerase (ATP-hydrolyzing) subunit A [Clostridia bacterium]
MDNNVIPQKITHTLEKNYMPYAVSVIVSRAIPEIDGLKPSHRKLLYTMYKMGLLRGNRTKSANVVGQTMKLNPHGDMAIYETLVRLTKGNEALLHPFIDSKGNFGKQYSKDMRYAASRYTEVKLDRICEEMFKDIDKNTVPFSDNYDGTMKEPVILPSSFPNVLVNPSQGIAVGMASNLCSFNLREVCLATIEYIRDPEVDLASCLKAPDFSTGGYILYDRQELETIYRTGRGSFKLRAKYRVDKKKGLIEITEIPYTTSTEAIIDSIIGLVKSSKIKEVTDVRDETDLNGLRITIEAKKSTDLDKLMSKLCLRTPLQEVFNCNFNILIEGKPMVLGVREILEYWIDFRIRCIRNQLHYDLSLNKDRLHLLLGLDRILIDIDEAIRIIRNTDKESQVVPNLMEAFRIDERQAEYIAEIKLRYLNREYILSRLDEIKDLRREITEMEETVKSNLKIKKIIITQLESVIQKYGMDRKTEILDSGEMGESTEDLHVEDYNLKVFFTKENYMKKIPLTSLRVNPEQKLKNTDQIVQEMESRNMAEILFFSDKANVYKMKLYQIEDCKAADFGEYLPNLLGMETGESIVYVLTTDDFKGDMVFGFENGKFARVPLEAYRTVTNRKKMAKAYFPESKIRFINHCRGNEDMDLAVMTRNLKALVFNTKEIPLKTTRSTQGITVIKLKKDDLVAQILPADKARLKDIENYVPNNVPAVGRSLSDRDKKRNQVSIFD